MSSPHPTPTQADDDAFYRQHLHGLIELGSAVARMVHDAAEAVAATAPKPQPEPPQPEAQPEPEQAAIARAAALAGLSAAFDRVARAVRRTVLLARSLAQPPRPAPDHRAARKRILREVEDAIGRQHAGPAAAVMDAELRERLDSPDLLEDLEAGRPVADIVNDIRHDLGIDLATFPRAHRRRTPADVALLRARAAGDTPLAPLEQAAAQARQTLPGAPPPPSDEVGDDIIALARSLAARPSG